MRLLRCDIRVVLEYPVEQSNSMTRLFPKSVILLAPYELDPGGNNGSMRRFTNLLTEQLRQQGYATVQSLAPPVIFGHLAPSGSTFSKWLGYIDKFIVNQVKLRFLRHAELIHICDQAYALYVPWINRFPHLVTCHDTIAIEAALGLIPGQKISFTGKIYQQLNLRGLQRARLIVCDSERTRTALVDIIGISPDRIRVVYIGLNYPYRKLSSDEITQHLKSLRIEAGNQILFHLGNNAFYKNRMGVLRIFLRAKHRNRNLRLIMAGPSFTEEMSSFIHHNSLESDVLEIINPSTVIVEALYNIADIFLFPSLDEGFGWPVIEAQACGTPVVSSNNGSLAEVAADSTLNANAADEDLLATHIECLLSDNGLRDEIVRKGYENIRRFSLENMMRGYVDAYAAAFVAK